MSCFDYKKKQALHPSLSSKSYSYFVACFMHTVQDIVGWNTKPFIKFARHIQPNFLKFHTFTLEKSYCRKTYRALLFCTVLYFFFVWLSSNRFYFILLFHCTLIVVLCICRKTNFVGLNGILSWKHLKYYIWCEETTTMKQRPHHKRENLFTMTCVKLSIMCATFILFYLLWQLCSKFSRTVLTQNNQKYLRNDYCRPDFI